MIIQIIFKSSFDILQYNPVFEAVVSVDKQGILNYWTGAKTEYQFPKSVDFESKLDTDLFEFAKQKSYPVSLCFSPNGKLFATYGSDRKVWLREARIAFLGFFILLIFI